MATPDLDELIERAKFLFWTSEHESLALAMRAAYSYGVMDGTRDMGDRILAQFPKPSPEHHEARLGPVTPLTEAEYEAALKPIVDEAFARLPAESQMCQAGLLAEYEAGRCASPYCPNARAGIAAPCPRPWDGRVTVTHLDGDIAPGVMVADVPDERKCPYWVKNYPETPQTHGCLDSECTDTRCTFVERVEARKTTVTPPPPPAPPTLRPRNAPPTPSPPLCVPARRLTKPFAHSKDTLKMTIHNAQASLTLDRAKAMGTVAMLGDFNLRTAEGFRGARLSLGLTSEELAIICNVARRTLQRWEAGRPDDRPPAPSACRIVEWLLAGYRPPQWPAVPGTTYGPGPEVGE